MTKIYVAGPYTSGDPAENVHNACKIADDLVVFGFWPYIPHLSHLWHLITPRPYDFWIKLDLEYLKICDLVFRLPGKSPGADKECAVAKMLGIPVVHTLYEAQEWVKSRHIYKRPLNEK